ncbi:MAG TPA: Spy/CpxP family protein refolding chaperone [Chitinophagaceae bacterium]|jgi:Spy/CpxP family protein refolding chaperone|nr:Spy/CpxP family protein refolding chaperone [Chitinophagaceae bacterium]
MKNSSTKMLTIAVVLLLLINIGLVIFMMQGRKKGADKGRGGKGDPSEMMAKELNMTEEQKKEHKSLKEEHLKNIKPLFDSVRAAKTAFYALLKDSTVNDSILTVYSNRISERQSAIDKQTFAHFKRIRNLFTPEQQPKFDEFLQKMMQRNRKDSGDKKERD